MTLCVLLTKKFANNRVDVVQAAEVLPAQPFQPFSISDEDEGVASEGEVRTHSKNGI